jgi:hypothetical protein
MDETIPIIAVTGIVLIWALIEIKSPLWIRLVSFCFAAIVIWNVVSISSSVMPTKEKALNSASFEQIEAMLEEGKKAEAIELLRKYMKDYQTEPYPAALKLYTSTVEESLEPVGSGQPMQPARKSENHMNH